MPGEGRMSSEMGTKGGNRNPDASKVSGAIAALCSLFVPGLGQILAGQIRRGLLLLSSLVSLSAILYWRIHLLAHRELGALAKISKAFDRKPVFVGLLLFCSALLWLWNSWDALNQTRRERRGGSAIFVLIIVVFFALGWQISEINLYKMITELPDAVPPLSKVLWPWKAAVTREAEEITAGADILIGCEDLLPPLPEKREGYPYLTAEPRCGELSRLDENNQVVRGTIITLTGTGFVPNTDTEIWWIDPLGNEFRPRQAGEYAHVQTDRNGSFSFALVMPYRLIPPSAAGPQIHRVEARQITDLGDLMVGEPLRL